MHKKHHWILSILSMRWRINIHIQTIFNISNWMNRFWYHSPLYTTLAHFSSITYTIPWFNRHRWLKKCLALQWKRVLFVFFYSTREFYLESSGATRWFGIWNTQKLIKRSIGPFRCGNWTSQPTHVRNTYDWLSGPSRLTFSKHEIFVIFFYQIIHLSLSFYQIC